MLQFVKSEADYLGNDTYAVLLDGDRVGTIRKVKPENFRTVGGGVSASWPWTSRRNNITLVHRTRAAAERRFAR